MKPLRLLSIVHKDNPFVYSANFISSYWQKHTVVLREHTYESPNKIIFKDLDYNLYTEIRKVKDASQGAGLLILLNIGKLWRRSERLDYAIVRNILLRE